MVCPCLYIILTLLEQSFPGLLNSVPPTFTLRPRDTVAYTLDEVRMPCQVQGEPQPRIRWYIGSTLLQESNKYSFQGGALIIHNVTREDDGRYECQAANGIDTIRTVAVLKVKGKTVLCVCTKFLLA
jgi:hypothetical protein